MRRLRFLVEPRSRFREEAEAIPLRGSVHNVVCSPPAAELERSPGLSLQRNEPRLPTEVLHSVPWHVGCAPDPYATTLLRIIAGLAEAEIGVITLPAANLFLQGRDAEAYGAEATGQAGDTCPNSKCHSCYPAFLWVRL